MISEQLCYLVIFKLCNTQTNCYCILVAVLNDLKNELAVVEFEKAHLSALLRNFSEERNIPYKDLMYFLRMTLSGLKVCSIYF